jgi:hypothetical protein
MFYAHERLMHQHFIIIISLLTDRLVIIADQLIFHVRDHYRATEIYPSPFCFCFEKASHYVSTEIYAITITS